MRIKLFITLLLLCFLNQCGSGATVTPPSELPSVKIGETSLDGESSTDLESIPTSLGITFPSAVDASSVTTDNVFVNCEDNIPATLTAAEDTDGIDNNEFTLNPTQPIPQKATCTLNFTDGVQTANITDFLDMKFASLFSETQSFSFSTPCASSTSAFFADNFSSDGAIYECFDVNNQNNGNVAFNTVDGELVADTSSSYNSGDGLMNFSKDVAANDDFEAILKITDFTGLDTLDDGVGIYYLHDGGNPSALCNLAKRSGSDVGVIFLAANASGSLLANSTDIIGQGTNITDVIGGEPLYIKITNSNNSFLCSYRIGDTGDYTDLNGGSSVSLGSNVTIPSFSIPFLHSPGGEMVITMDELIVKDLE